MAIMPARREDRPETQKQLLVERETMTEAAFVCHAVIENPDTPEDMREHALNVFSDVNFWLAFSDARGCPTDRTIRMLPIGFKWPGFFTDMVEVLLIYSPRNVIDERSGQVALARWAAKEIDDEGYSSDWRLDMYDALNKVVASLKAAADDAELVEVDS
jgi:hypothetical protein